MQNSFGSMVNSNCCPICTGMPGTLPTLNKSVVDYAVRMGYALHCSINNICKMDRKTTSIPICPKRIRFLSLIFRCVKTVILTPL